MLHSNIISERGALHSSLMACEVSEMVQVVRGSQSRSTAMDAPLGARRTKYLSSDTPCTADSTNQSMAGNCAFRKLLLNRFE